MASKKFYTTGEAAELLNISRSTISRKFDRGVFFGKKNPITGERMISRESLLAFMKQYNLSRDAMAIDKKQVLVGSSDGPVVALLEKTFSEDDRVEMEQVGFGGDVLVRCSRERPDLLLIDEELPDIPAAEVIRSLRRTGGEDGLRVVCLSKARNVKRCLEWGADETWVKDGLEAVDLQGKVYGALGLTEEQEAQGSTHEHQRRWPRVAVTLPARIGVYRIRSPHRRDRGEATVENISCGGAYLSGLKLDSGLIPCEPFRLSLEVMQEPLEMFRTHCRVVRLQSNGSLSAGVQFTRLSRANLGMIEAIAQARQENASGATD